MKQIRAENLLEDLVAGRDPKDLSPTERTEVEELATFIQSSRTSLRDSSEWSSQRELALVDRVLARTTQEDLSWRGELRVLGGFIRDRLHSSPVLRLVAASLLVHLIAVPTFAYFLYRDRAPAAPIQVRIVPREYDSDRFDLPEEEQEELSQPPESLTDDLLAGPDLDRLDNAVRRARWVLSTSSGIVMEQAGDVSSLERNLIRARSRLLARREWTNWLDDREEWERSSLLGKVLWAEVLLDMFVLEGERPVLLGRALNHLALSDAPESAGIAPLLGSTLDRARAYGAWNASSGFDTATVALPLGEEWFGLLQDAATHAGIGLAPELEALASWTAR